MKLQELQEGRIQRRGSADPIRRELWSIIDDVLLKQGYERTLTYTDRGRSKTLPLDGSKSKIAIGSGKSSKMKFRISMGETRSGTPHAISSDYSANNIKKKRKDVLVDLNIAIQRQFNTKYTPSVFVKHTGSYFQVYKRNRGAIVLKSEQ